MSIDQDPGTYSAADAPTEEVEVVTQLFSDQDSQAADVKRDLPTPQRFITLRGALFIAILTAAESGVVAYALSTPSESLNNHPAGSTAPLSQTDPALFIGNAIRLQSTQGHRQNIGTTVLECGFEDKNLGSYSSVFMGGREPKVMKLQSSTNTSNFDGIQFNNSVFGYGTVVEKAAPSSGDNRTSWIDVGSEIWSSDIYINRQKNTVSLHGGSTEPVINSSYALSSSRIVNSTIHLNPGQAKGGVVGGMDYAIENQGGTFYIALDCDKQMQTEVAQRLNHPNDPVNAFKLESQN